MSRDRIPAVIKRPLKPILEKRLLAEYLVDVLYLIVVFSFGGIGISGWLNLTRRKIPVWA